LIERSSGNIGNENTTFLPAFDQQRTPQVVPFFNTSQPMNSMT